MKGRMDNGEENAKREKPAWQWRCRYDDNGTNENTSGEHVRTTTQLSNGHSATAAELIGHTTPWS